MSAHAQSIVSANAPYFVKSRLHGLNSERVGENGTREPDLVIYPGYGYFWFMGN